MKVDRPAVIRFDAAELAFAVDFADATLRGVSVELDLLPASSLVVLKPAPCGVESVAKSNIDIFVRVIGRAEEVRERFYAITLDRKLTHPAVVAISEAARKRLFTE